MATRLNRNAIPVPSAISVNMFGFMVLTDRHPRMKKGAAPHSTTGAARTSWIHAAQPAGTMACSGRPGIMSPIAYRNRGRVKTVLIQNRRVMSSSSLRSSSSETVSASSAMPQIGQPVFDVSRTCGCIGQVHTVPE